VEARNIRFGVEHLHRTGPEAVSDQYLLWRKCRDLWKHWAPVRNPDLSGARKMECVKSDLEEQAEHLGPAGNCGHAFCDPNGVASLGEQRPQPGSTVAPREWTDAQPEPPRDA
jgi:hypothetical protein